GDRISFAGPKTCPGLAEGIDFHLLVADETALPAVGRGLEEAPARTRGHSIVEGPTADDIQDIPTEAGVGIDWLARGSIAPGDPPARTRGHVVVAAPTSDDIQDVPAEADAEIAWLVRGSVAPGESGLMYEAVRSPSLPARRTFAWCAGETLTIAPIRRCLRRD